MGRLFALIIVLLVSAAVPATAGEQSVASATTTLKETAIAGLGTAGFVVVWTGDDGTGDLNVYARRYLGSGAPLGSAFRVNVYADSWQSNPSVAALSGGGFVVVWQSSGQDGSQFGIYGRRYAADGTPAGDEFRVNENWSFSQSNPRVVGLASGGFVVVWQSPDMYNTWTDEIFARIYNATAEPLGGEIQVNTFTSGLNTIFGRSDSQMHPAVASLPAGGFVVVWESYREYDGYNVNKGISCRRFAANGTPLEQNEFPVNVATAGDQERPAVAPRQGGGFLVVWHTPEPATGDLEVHVQCFDGSGARVGNEVRVNTFTADNQLWPEAVLLDGGDNLVAWYSNWQDGDSGEIYARRIAPGGNFAGDEFRINADPAGYQYDHALSPSPGGGWLASWSSSLGGGASYGISVRLPPVITVSLPPQSDVPQVPVTLAASPGAGVAEWCLSESATPAACLWSVSAPSSHTFAGNGARVLHAYARDSRGNIGTASATTQIGPIPRLLSVAIAGNGAGSVGSTPGGIDCPGSCSAQFDGGTLVQLAPVPRNDSVFGGWSGPCSVVGENCRVMLDAARSVTATFNLAPQIKLDPGAADGYATLVAAYAAASGNLFSMDTLLVGNWTLDRGTPIVWKGGYRADYASRSGYTILKGVLLIRSGSLRIDGVRIRP